MRGTENHPIYGHFYKADEEIVRRNQELRPQNEARQDTIWYLLNGLAFGKFQLIFPSDSPADVGYQDWVLREVAKIETTLKEATFGRWEPVKRFMMERTRDSWDSRGHSVVPSAKGRTRFKGMPDYDTAIFLANVTEVI